MAHNARYVFFYDPCTHDMYMVCLPPRRLFHAVLASLFGNPKILRLWHAILFGYGLSRIIWHFRKEILTNPHVLINLFPRCLRK